MMIRERKTAKKVLALLLALTMIIALFPGLALAENGMEDNVPAEEQMLTDPIDGDGSEAEDRPDLEEPDGEDPGQEPGEEVEEAPDLDAPEDGQEEEEFATEASGPALGDGVAEKGLPLGEKQVNTFFLGQNNFVVTSFDSLQAAIQDFISGEENVTITIQGEIEITAPLRISNPNQSLYLIGGTLLRGTEGILLEVGSDTNLILEDVVLDGQKESQGTGSGPLLYVDGGDVCINNGSVLSNNRNDIDHGGAVYLAAGKVKLEESQICDNEAAGNGGGVCVNDGALTMNRGKIFGNRSEANGGGIYAFNAAVEITDGEITANGADGNGGGVGVDAGSQFAMSGGSSISGNRSQSRGGGLFAEESEVTIRGGDIWGNTAGNTGGGVHIGSNTSVTMQDGRIYDNEARTGGGITLLSPMNMFGGQIYLNRVLTGTTEVNGGTYLTMKGGLIFGKAYTLVDDGWTVQPGAEGMVLHFDDTQAPYLAGQAGGLALWHGSAGSMQWRIDPDKGPGVSYLNGSNEGFVSLDAEVIAGQTLYFNPDDGGLYTQITETAFEAPYQGGSHYGGIYSDPENPSVLILEDAVFKTTDNIALSFPQGGSLYLLGDNGLHCSGDAGRVIGIETWADLAIGGTGTLTVRAGNEKKYTDGQTVGLDIDGDLTIAPGTEVIVYCGKTDSEIGSIGIQVNGDFIIGEGAWVNAVGGVADRNHYAESMGIAVLGWLTVASGAQVEAYGQNAGSSSTGLLVSGLAVEQGAAVISSGEEAQTSFGLFLKGNREEVSSVSGLLIATADSAEAASVGLYSGSPLALNGEIIINAGGATTSCGILMINAHLDILAILGNVAVMGGTTAYAAVSYSNEEYGITAPELVSPAADGLSVQGYSIEGEWAMESAAFGDLDLEAMGIDIEYLLSENDVLEGVKSFFIGESPANYLEFSMAGYAHFNAGDIAAVNAIIEAHPEWGKTPFAEGGILPQDWQYAVEWDRSEVPYRVKTLNLGGAGLTGTLDVGGISALESLFCDENELTALYASGLQNLSSINCQGNRLETLDVSGTSYLTSLLCSDNRLEELDLSDNVYMRELDCGFNRLNSLNVGQCTLLEILQCDNNQLEELELGGLSQLQFLVCSNNQIKTLDVSSNNLLYTLACAKNQLSALDLSGNNGSLYAAAFNGQSVEVDLVRVGGADYSAEIALNNPQFTPSGYISYENGMLRGADVEQDTVAFQVDTGYQDMVLEGEMNLRYLDAYTVTVNNGYGGGVHPETYTVTITAQEAPAGQRFKEWIVVSGDITLEDPTASTTTFVMPTQHVEVTATYEDGYYAVKVNNGKGSGQFPPHSTVTIQADAPSEGQRFQGWVVEKSDIVLASRFSPITTFVMPAEDVEVTAIYAEEDADYLVQVNGGRGSGSYSPGATVTIVAEPPSGQRFQSWLVVSGGVTLKDAAAGTTTFTMPHNNVEVTAKFSALPSGGGGGSSTYTVTFDTRGGSAVSSQRIAYNGTVKEPEAPTREGYVFTEWYMDTALKSQYDFAAKVTKSFTLYAGWQEEGETLSPYIQGYPDGTFRPDGSITRAEAAQIFYNIQGGALTRSSTSDFSDVVRNDWHYEAVTALADAGVIEGYPDGTFGPDKTINRAEFCALLIRYAGKEPEGEADFADVLSSHWAARYIAAARMDGLVEGYPDGTFGPEDQQTRAQAVTALNRLLGRSSDGAFLAGLEMPFQDVPRSHWAFEEIMAAAVSHIVPE